jgi:hypothetical protein
VDGKYAGLFSCRACHEQIRIAKEAGLVLVGVMESEGQGLADIGLEKETCAHGRLLRGDFEARIIPGLTQCGLINFHGREEQQRGDSWWGDESD